jgi:fructokinase
LLKTIGDDDAVWDGVAHALGSLCATLVLMVSVERIVISGGREGGRKGGKEGGCG